MSAPRWWALLLSGASAACAFAALGVALYAGHPRMGEAGRIFAGVGFVTGMLCLWLPMWLDALPLRRRAGLPGGLGGLGGLAAAGAAAGGGASAGAPAAPARPRRAAISEPLTRQAGPGAAASGAAATSVGLAATAPAGADADRPPAAGDRPGAQAEAGAAARPAAQALARALADTRPAQDGADIGPPRPRLRAHSQALDRSDALAG